MKSIAIIGAGLAGLTLAHRLQELADITVLEKSRGVGGRMSSRRAHSFGFDHGAQFFTARSPQFRQFLARYIDAGSVQEWHAKLITIEPGKKPYKRLWFEPHWVASPAMNALARALANPKVLQLDTQVQDIIADGDKWLLATPQGEHLGPFDWVVCTAPAPQSSRLLPTCFAHKPTLDKVVMGGCYSLMLGFDTEPQLGFDAAQVNNSAIGWIANNSRKPGRSDGCSLLIQSTNTWADQHMEDEIEQVKQALLDALRQLLPQLPLANHVDIHRWRYARPLKPATDAFLMDQQQRLAACGDWCMAGRVEAAFTSATNLAAALEELI